MKYLLTFATAEYREAAQQLKRTAEPFFDKVIIAQPGDLTPRFRKANAKLFEYRRGFGYWCWKPWIVLQQLKKMGLGDVLMYCDAQCQFVANPKPLFELAGYNDGMGLFHQRREGHKLSTWCRGDTFELMGCVGERYTNGDLLNSAFSVWTTDAMPFVEEWLKWCCEYQVVSDEPSVFPNCPSFKAHRHDQSIQSLLAIKHHVDTFRDPSQWGNGWEGEKYYSQIIHHNRTVIAPFHMRPTMSSVVEVSTVATCPLKCTYCPQDKLEHAYQGPKHLTIEMFAICLSNMTPGDAIHFSGFVEPAVNPHLIPLMRMAIDGGFRVSLYTTGRGLHLEGAKEVAAMLLEKLVLHLPDANGRLGHAASNLPVLFELAKHSNVSCMAMDNLAHPAVDALYNSLPRNYGAMIDRAGNVESTTLPVAHTARKKGPVQCSVAPQLDHSVLLPSGDLALCCMDYGLAHVIGNLATTPYSTILRGEALNRLREQQRLSDSNILCRSCSCAVPA